MENKIFEQLNEHQLEAVRATEGQIRIVAGAGSGKTRVIAHRYAYLVNEVGIDPANILCLTFTNKAANEMKSRIGKLVSAGHVNDWINTIHGFCVKFLRKEIFRLGYPKNFSILDEDDSKMLAKQVMEEFNLDRTVVTVRQFVGNIAAFKSNNEYIDTYMLPDHSSQDENGTKETKWKNSSNEDDALFMRYLELQLKSYALDFQDLMEYTLYILNRFKDVREFWQDKINYMMVDEVQDCNANDWQLIRLLCEKYNNLFIVGDPDQAIYEWRGSNPELFIQFQPDVDIVLNENYRSTPNILDVANSIIENNHNRIHKNLFTSKAANCRALHLHAKTEEEEANWIANEIKRLKNAGNDYDDCAILYRNSYLSRNIEQSLVKKHIPYSVWGGIRFFERKEIKDALSYLHFIAFKDDLAFIRIINTPSRKFGKKTLDKLKFLAKAENDTLYEALWKHQNAPDFKKKSYLQFIQLIDDCTERKDRTLVSELLEYILKQSGLKNSWREDEIEDRLENIAELMNSIKYYEKENAEDGISLEHYLQDISLYTNADYKKEGPTVKLMTIHQAKGLEFPYVFVVGLSEGIFPSHRSIREMKMKGEEEERRLMYVAITRAERAIYLTESEGYNTSIGGNKYPSRFLNEIKDNLIQVEGVIDPALRQGTLDMIHQISVEIGTEEDNSDWKVGDWVSHKIFGEGQIMAIDKNKGSIKVNFKGAERYLQPKFLQKKI